MEESTRPAARRPKKVQIDATPLAKKKELTANLTGTKYDIVKEVVQKSAFRIADDDPFSYLIWNDTWVAVERITDLKDYQRINHFPGMGEITRKDSLAFNMSKVAKRFPDDFNFVPRSWILPAEYNALQSYAVEAKKNKKNVTFIYKPSNGAMGNGIQLYRQVERIPNTEHHIVQTYIDRPLLISRMKFDLRLYVLVTSCDPLRAFFFDDGLVRMSTEEYKRPAEDNINCSFMHLTNYSVNKKSGKYQPGSETSGSKRSIRYLREKLKREGQNGGATFWRNVEDVLVKTLLVAAPHITSAYKLCRPASPPGADSVCFEILGFDILVDEDLKPWVLEVNRSPSFGTDEKLDYDIKSVLLRDALKLVNIRFSDREKSMQAQKEAAQKRLLQPQHRPRSIDPAAKKAKVQRETDSKKQHLLELLTFVRRHGDREEHEEKHKGRFRRIFPPADRFKLQSYITLMQGTFEVLVPTSRLGQQQCELLNMTSQYSEHDIIDMIEQCDADEKTKRASSKAFHSLPSVEPRDHASDSDDDEYDRRGASARSGRSSSVPPSSSKVPTLPKRPPSGNKPTAIIDPLTLLVFHQRETAVGEPDQTANVLKALNAMQIKFPGKAEQDSGKVLAKVREEWRVHKKYVATYWFIKLDNAKREKVMRIAMDNIERVLEHFHVKEDSSDCHLHRIFKRLLTRMLWNHGAGLWNCFSSNLEQSAWWERAFVSGSDSITADELLCCRRVVQLCKECLLVVYLFSSESQKATAKSPVTIATRRIASRADSSMLPPNGRLNKLDATVTA